MTGAPGLEDLLRACAPQVLGALVRRHGQFDAAEDAVQEALLAAFRQWPTEGVPENPRSWLVTVAARRLTDTFRSESARQRRELVSAPEEPPPVPGTDDTLTLFFLCCHPALSPTTQAALTLRAVGGLTTAEVAAAFLVPEATMAQRISRAKARLRGAEFVLPPPEDRAQRLSVVLRVLYLIFNEGYVATAGPALHRADLTAEAIRLTRAIRASLPTGAHPSAGASGGGASDTGGTPGGRGTPGGHGTPGGRGGSNDGSGSDGSGSDGSGSDGSGPGSGGAGSRGGAELAGAAGEVAGLLALMLLTEARRPARLGADGDLVPLADQDRLSWDGALISEGVALLTETLPVAPLGPYQLQAAIAAVHAEAPSAADTDWPQIVALYTLLERFEPGPMVTLNRAVAVAQVHGPQAGLELLDTLRPQLDRHHRWHAVRAHLLELAGDPAGARAAYREAARRTLSRPEQRYLNTRASRLAGG
ncbi:RNA polymerase sigma factor [Cryptosporangium japonicum]|uniref:Uncharacterized protein n=1 Tax=Cryptosporangium japonicum TaxID=80872 RepID=A0ABN0URV7_9ACTN